MQFNPGEGTLNSISLEAAFVEATQLLELAEEASPNPTAVNFTAVDHNNNTKLFNISCTMPVKVTMAGGKPTFEPDLTKHVSPAFLKGGDISAESLCGAVLELAHKIQDTELANTANPNRVSIDYSTDNMTASITGSIPAVRSVSASGSIDTSVTPYLV